VTVLMAALAHKLPSRRTSTASAVSSQAEVSEHRPASAVGNTGAGGRDGRITVSQIPKILNAF